jgi:hypothetical protein
VSAATTDLAEATRMFARKAMTTVVLRRYARAAAFRPGFAG